MFPPSGQNNPDLDRRLLRADLKHCVLLKSKNRTLFEGKEKKGKIF